MAATSGRIRGASPRLSWSKQQKRTRGTPRNDADVRATEVAKANVQAKVRIPLDTQIGWNLSLGIEKYADLSARSSDDESEHEGETDDADQDPEEQDRVYREVDQKKWERIKTIYEVGG